MKIRLLTVPQLRDYRWQIMPHGPDSLVNTNNPERWCKDAELIQTARTHPDTWCAKFASAKRFIEDNYGAFTQTERALSDLVLELIRVVEYHQTALHSVAPWVPDQEPDWKG